MEDKIKEIVHHTLLISQKEKVLRQERFKRGECFNVFEIMHAEHYEVTTHSTMLASLLDPNGSHGAGNIFLNLFMEQIISLLIVGVSFNSNTFRFNTNSAKVKVEYSIGKIDNNNEEGGRIDILIENDNLSKAIIIENKIYADDQPQQLYRYHEFAENKYGSGNYILLYLTLNGHSPSDKSIKNGNSKPLKENEDFYCISYADEISKWISSCKEKAVAMPVVRETMTQYLDLILKLTNQNMENTIKEELVAYLATPENIDAVCKIQKVYDAVRNEIFNKELKKQVKEIANKMKLYFHPDFDITNINWCKQYEGQFYFYKPEWESFCICFEFMSDGLKNFNYGIKYRDASKIGSKKDEKGEMYSHFGGSFSEWYAFYKPFPIHNWNDETDFEKLYDDDRTFQKLIEDKVSELLDNLKPDKFGKKISL